MAVPARRDLTAQRYQVEAEEQGLKARELGIGLAALAQGWTRVKTALPYLAVGGVVGCLLGVWLLKKRKD